MNLVTLQGATLAFKKLASELDLSCKVAVNQKTALPRAKRIEGVKLHTISSHMRAITKNDKFSLRQLSDYIGCFHLGCQNSSIIVNKFKKTKG